MTQTVQDDSLSIADRIREALDNDELQLPPQPDLAIRLQEMLQDENLSGAPQVAALVRNDPAVTASVLRCANSAAFGGLRQISDLSQAIARLGLARVASLVTTVQLRGNFSTTSADKKELLNKLWDHAVASALASRRLAGKADCDVEGAYLGGLLHDVGNLLVLKGVDYLEASEPTIEITRPVLDELMEVLHTELGHRTLTAWNLPDSICEVALKHEEEGSEEQSALLCVVQAADAISRKLGFHLQPDPELDLLTEPVMENLEVTDIELAALMVDLEDEINAVRKLF